jgi:hypothetical protein
MTSGGLDAVLCPTARSCTADLSFSNAEELVRRLVWVTTEGDGLTLPEG